MTRVYIAVSDFDTPSIEKIREAGGEVVVCSENEGRPSHDTLSEIVGQFDALIIGISERMSKDIYKRNKAKFIGTLSIGMDHIDQEFRMDESITVINSPTANVVSVAEHVFGMIIALMKQFPRLGRNVMGQGQNNYATYDLQGKVLGVVGAGLIGRKVMQLARAFEMKILCYTFHPEKHTDLLKAGVEFVSLEDIFLKSQIISLHVPLSEDSRKLVDGSLLDLMNRSAILVNTARMEIVDNKYLLAKLEKEEIFGVGLDGDFENGVIEMMKRMASKNLIVTPHRAGSTVDANLRMDQYMTEELIKWMERAG